MASATDASLDIIPKRRGLSFSSLLRLSISWVVPNPSGRDKIGRSSGNKNDNNGSKNGGNDWLEHGMAR